MKIIQKSRSLQRGFTLIELMVVITIVAIISVITYASYRHVVIKTKRTEAKSALFQALQQQERYYTQNSRYVAFAANNNAFKWFSGDNAAQSAYELKAEACTGETIRNCVKITAIPGTDNVDGKFKDAECGELSLTSTNIKAHSGAAPMNTCW